ncbi:tRNA 5-methoxyuridine(34)/uridine 5-oxyacetic acid(34) synthase CmoB [Vibrio sp. 10N.222.51.C8]|jgi:tRNA (mo5U34)-methyltransferase|uniref:tRNA 5-methoxyuridine(34)/uridine 5-oxyacetic acid(34) synthase CmoB n=1 Tax=Vibrio TaxID=662 RepID=UPI0002F4E288|nr:MULTISPECIES: tRNA 5-methoxyuridine(34)/uridine 5-oxyacetic acid(34) synthase CmoB [Vibrio]ANP76164.1 tRNA 5-methoxyuridine(34) synthase CmoB [Vibrio crassostreae 9CS106]MCC4888243.1 tRNA 5-methoxyuridine(34)/uridine 5-oxyacetic acid(34) synthase CmoB [Vibrio sp. F13]OED82515.1 tRNA 5-methoxyuridine(34)/uridine 5-oxyacetic acid(34) synthase CmoB [Vibrio crassostreae ZF-91]OEE86051.1 tRNA 5-methoxyuridine(34)/uridine 5-oxyacetic acid(34) synthase CmoB [Vibrio crassostreae 9ZC88]OEF05695.1 tR
MFNFANFYQLIAQDTRLQPWLNVLPQQLTDWQNAEHGDFDRWLRALNKIPQDVPDQVDLKNSVTIGSSTPYHTGELKKLESLLKTFHPWRKGPYTVHDIHIDTEWRSDWKWDRVLPHISPLKNRSVLDVGCGNGYHMWRMLGEGARLTVGIDPSHLFLVQFEAIRKLMGDDQRAHLLPLGIEQLPKLEAYDTVFSMGVLYHRRSPLDHLIQLKDQLVSGGELVLETLVIEGDENAVLVPVDRYAQMRNVYFFPSARALKRWLEQVGFEDVRIVDENVTTIGEQRTTEWMTHNSLPDYLDPNDPSKTVEGHPAPRRAILVATKP